MARAHRHFIPGCISHITHRCHKKEFLRRCLVYVDLNMVRAGVVRHPAEWAHGGYHKIQGNRRWNTILSLDALAEIAEVDNLEELASAHREWVEEAMISATYQRDEAWSRSLAVGSEEYVLKTQEILGVRGRGSFPSRRFQS